MTVCAVYSQLTDVLYTWRIREQTTGGIRVAARQNCSSAAERGRHIRTLEDDVERCRRILFSLTCICMCSWSRCSRSRTTWNIVCQSRLLHEPRNLLRPQVTWPKVLQVLVVIVHFWECRLKFHLYHCLRCWLTCYGETTSISVWPDKC